MGPGPQGHVARRRGGLGPGYDVWFAPGDGLAGSCGCPDFAKASLGLCKHLLAAAQAHGVASMGARALRWDPVRPLRGADDALARLWCASPVGFAPADAGLFQRDGRLDAEELGARRRATVERLREACRGAPLLAEPAVVRLLDDEAGRLEHGMRVGEGELDALLAGMARPLFPYQREGVTRFLRAGRLLLADDMGLGKTAQAIAACHALVGAGVVSRVLIVTPAPLKPQWTREWRLFTPLPITPVDGRPAERAAQYSEPGTQVLLVNYEQLLRDLPAAQRFAPELVILDEAQRIKNWQTRTAAAVKQLAPAWRLVLTGTPMENRLDELASIMEWVDERALEPRWRLGSWHALRHDGRRAIVGARNLDTLRARLAPSMVRRVRAEVLSQLPPRRDVVLPVLLGPEQLRVHMVLESKVRKLLRPVQKRPLTREELLQLMQLLARQRMVCNAVALRNFDEAWPVLRAQLPAEAVIAMHSGKLLDLRERLVELTAGQGLKVVVFSQWRRMLQLAQHACGDVLAAAGVRAVFFTGQEAQKRRQENLVAFHDDPETRVLFATDAGGVGLNLQRAASCCINLELPWNPAVLEQRVGRVYRMGQERPVEIYNYVAVGGIEERISRLVGDKQALFSGLFDEHESQVAFEGEGSFLTRMNEVLRSASELEEEVEDAVVRRPPLGAMPGMLAPVAPPPRLPRVPALPVAPGRSHMVVPPAAAAAPVLSATEIAALVEAISQLDARPALGKLLRDVAAAIEGTARGLAN